VSASPPAYDRQLTRRVVPVAAVGSYLRLAAHA